MKGEIAVEGGFRKNEDGVGLERLGRRSSREGAEWERACGCAGRCPSLSFALVAASSPSYIRLKREAPSERQNGSLAGRERTAI